MITEATLRVLLKDADLASMGEYRVEEGTIVTPSARAYLIDNKIGLFIGDKCVITPPRDEAAEKPAERPRQRAQAQSAQGEPSFPADFSAPARYHGPGGGFFEEKPEHMTAVRGTTLVFKDHPVIVLRGKIDSFESKIIGAQLALRKSGMEKCVADLGEVLTYVRTLLRAEVTEEALAPMVLLGMDDMEIRARSHKPKQYYGVGHFMPSVDDGEAVVLLNELRSAVREVEIAAYTAFKDVEGVPTRNDIARALNRLSSLFYVMMFRAKTGEYGP